MGSTFTLYADFNLIDGGSTLTKNVTIATNTQVIGDGGVIFDNATVALVDGVLQVELPDNTNDPFVFGFTVRRATGLTKTWRVPVQEPGVRVLLTQFTSTTPLPLPPSGNAVSQTDFTAYEATAAAALAAETTRATAAEAAAVTTAAADATAKVAAETSRATTAEATKVNSSTYTSGQTAQDTALATEATTARAAELALRNLTDSTFATNLSASYSAKLDNVTVSADGPLAVDKITKVDALAAARTVTLPNGTIKGQQIEVQKIDYSLHTVTISGKIHSTGTSTFVLNTQYDNQTFVWGGTFWETGPDHRTKSSLETLSAPVAGRHADSAKGRVAANAHRNVFAPFPRRVVTESISDAVFCYPAWMSSDGVTLFGNQGPWVRSSVDNGATWTTIHDFGSVPTSQNVVGVRQMTNGELFCSVKAVGTPGELWASSGYGTGTVNWTKVLTSGDAGNQFHQDWGMCVEGGATIVVSEYGNKTSQGATIAPRYVYLSDDYGLTWRTVFDLWTYATDQPNAHVHGSWWDKYQNRVWVTAGDNDNRLIAYSDDKGATWTFVSRGTFTNQPVGIYALPSCILFTTDSVPNGVLRIWRKPVGETLDVEVAYSADTSLSLTTIGGAMFRRDETSPLLIPLIRNQTVSGRGRLIATQDGVDFYETWADDHDYAAGPSGGLYKAFGPTTTGKMVGALADDRNGSGSWSRLVWRSTPTFNRRTRKNAFEIVSSYATTAAGKAAASCAYSSTMDNVTDLDLRVKASHATWVPGAESCLISKNLGSDNNAEWYWVVTTGGLLRFYWYPTKLLASLKGALSTAAGATMIAGKAAYLRCTFRANNGSGNYEVKFYESSDDGATWAQIGSTITGAGTSSLPATGPNGLVVGGTGPTGVSQPFLGNFYKASALRGVASTDVIGEVDFTGPAWQLGDINPTDVYSAVPSYTDSAKNVWKLLGSTQIRGTIARDAISYIDKPALPVAATDAATTLALANSMRQALIDAGITT